MISARLVTLAVSLLVVTGTGSAQQTNAARLSGTVVTNDLTPQPVRRAIVRLGGQGAEGRSAITDDAGRFTLVGLPAGRFTLTASKAAHLTTAYGASAPGRPGTVVTLTAGQSIANLQLVLPRGAVVAGAIRDRRGLPIAGVPIGVVRVGAAPSVASPPTNTTTDDRGMFRIFGLMPGTYAVAALPRLTAATERAIEVLSSSEMDALFRMQQSRASGSVPAATTPVRPPDGHAYAAVFFPGTAVAADAGQISLRAGETRDNVDFVVDLVRVATIEGTVSAPGTLPELDISLGADGPRVERLLWNGMSIATRPGVDGRNTFKLTNVTPGHYTLLARSSYTRTTITPTSSSSTHIDPETVPSLWGAAGLDVAGEPISGISIQLQPAMTVSGKVAFEATALKPPENLRPIRVSMVMDAATSGRLGSALLGGLLSFGLPSDPTVPTFSGQIRSDGTFQIVGLLPGRYRLSATPPSVQGGTTGWWLRSAIAGTSDLLDVEVDLTNGSSVSDVVLTFSDRHTEVSGFLQTAAGQPAPEYVVAVFPTSASLWSTGGRRLKSARPASDGHFSFPDMPPGDYILAALTDAADDDWQTPATLQDLIKTGVKITLGDGEKKTQNLQIGR